MENCEEDTSITSFIFVTNTKYNAREIKAVPAAFDFVAYTNVLCSESHEVREYRLFEDLVNI